MFTIDRVGEQKARRLRSSTMLTEHDFRKIAKAIGAKPVKARKIGFVAGHKADQRERVDTFWNGKETTNMAQRGDWIVINVFPSGQPLRDKSGKLNRYVIKSEAFANLYEPAAGESELGPIFRSKSIIEAIHLPGGFDILAPWGEQQTALAGYILLNGGEVYGNNEDTFAQTYEIID
ncbi:MAG: hypothetical protein ACLPKB_17950 [Xanthobacteraceae bacterium]